MQQLLLESIRGYSVIVVDSARTITEWNVGAELTFGFKAQQMLGTPIDVIFTQEDRAAGVPAKELEQAAANGSAPDERWHLRADGARRYVNGRTQVIRLDGEVVGFIKIGHDETERRNAIDETRKAQRAAESANAAKDQFLAVLSHELRNPLTPILTAATLMLNDARLPNDVRDELHTIQRNAQLEARLIDDLLDVTRIARGKLHIEMRPVQLETLITHVLDICRPEIKARDLDVNLSLMAHRSCVYGDGARLQQILWNLIRNAIKFSPRNSRITIEVDNPMPGKIVLSVKDQGIGIAERDRERIFHPFEQAEPTFPHRYGGLGLGLSISRALAELHEGSLELFSDGPGHGATFQLTLPTIQEESCSPDLGMPLFREQPARSSLRILLVEDNLDTAKGLSKLLSSLGHSVSTATDVTTAIGLAESNVFDVMLSDIGLGEQSGLDLVRALHTRFPHLRPIAVSGYGTPADIERSKAAGFERHLVKPVDLELLQQVLNDIAMNPAGKK
jgi:PAS domain S-box-containing protein